MVEFLDMSQIKKVIFFLVEIFIIFNMYNMFFVLMLAGMKKIQLIMPVLLQKILDW